MSASLAENALAYASDFHLRVFPCAPREKRPHGKLVQRGFLNATDDVGIIENWWRREPEANIAVACAASGLLVLDVDPRNGGDETLGALERELGSLPTTWRTLTPGGGQHVFFRLPKGVERWPATLGPGLDLKVDGYVLVAPSVHPNGGTYRWDVAALPSETALAEVPPQWLFRVMNGQRPKTDNAPPSLPGGDPATSDIGMAFAAAGWLGEALSDGRRAVRCPWAASHSDGRGDGKDSSAVIFAPVKGSTLGGFHCSHAHCSERTALDAIAAAGGLFSSADTPKDAPEAANSIGALFEARKRSGPIVHEPTGLRDIDRFTRGGPTYGSTIFVIGAPDAAKTLLLWVIAVAYARRGVVVGFMAVDEEPEDLLTRLVQMTPYEWQTPDGELIERRFSRAQFETADDATLDRMRVAVGELPIFIYAASWTIEKAADDLAARAKACGKRPAFFVDSLQTAECDNVRNSEREVTERRHVTGNAYAVRQAAIRHRMITMATSESNREWSKAKGRVGKSSSDNPSAMAAGAESRAVEFRARVVIALSVSPDDENVIQVDIPKNKLGRRAEPAFWLRVDRETQTFFDAERPEQTRTPAGKRAAYQQSLEAQRADKRAREEHERQEKVAKQAAEQARQDDALRATVAERDGITEADVLVSLRARLGSCGDKAGRAIIERARLAGWLEVRAGRKNAKTHHLRPSATDPTSPETNPGEPGAT